MYHYTISLTILLFSLSLSVIAGGEDEKNNINWHNRTFIPKKFSGISTERAYFELLKDKQSKKIIVAVIDSGTDIEHEDLQGKIWTNPNEIPDNGIDDDKNGYVDDIHGWNFLGGPDGSMINYETLEITRLYRTYKKKCENVNQTNKGDHQLYEEYKAAFEKQVESSKDDSILMMGLSNTYDRADRILKEYLKKEVYTKEDIKGINTEVDSINAAKRFMNILRISHIEKSYIDEVKDYIKTTYDYNLNIEFNPRTVTGDNPNDLNNRNYGNNKVIGEVADHGTHVAGIIGAVRNNDIGMNGVAENIELMILRAVPIGDERDKDIALAIRYAVDNGARIINMSFGKRYSPHRKMVTDAIAYAGLHNVLLIHAAGNDAENIDEVTFYPSHKIGNEMAINWINVGAIDQKIGKKLVANFSNYGQTMVDVYAPGVQIYSLNPNNKYHYSDGTSMASPVVAGVAALVLSYFPELTAIELRAILLESSIKMDKLKVHTPNNESKGKKVRFKSLSTTAGIINVYNAIELASRRH